VKAQEFSSVEHLILDGGSTDDTRGLVAGEFQHARFFSEGDSGLYDAINQGVRMARGEIIGLLNSDDLLAPGALAAVAEAMRDSAVDLVSGKFTLFDERGERECAVPKLTVQSVMFGACAINARFVRRSVWERVGPFELRYRIAADRDWLLRLMQLAPHEVCVDRVLYRYRQHEGSLTLDRAKRHIDAYREEHLEIAEKLLAHPTLRIPARRLHARDSAQCALRAMRAGRWRECIAYARRGSRVNWTWPAIFARHVAGELFGGRAE
jgi:glycosyltransferase involved in cell wall biosynthesis